MLLLRGEFDPGLDLYEFRWIFSGMPKDALKLPIPVENPAGRSIIVFDEQGLGDAIQFARYLLLLAGRGASVAFFCRKRLQRLFKGLDKPIRIVDCAEPNERFDYQIALSSLPRAFKTRLAAIPARLSARRLPWCKSGRREADRMVSRPAFAGAVKADPARSIPLACFAKLAQMDGMRLISIQKLDVCAYDESLPGLIEPGEDFVAGPEACIDTAAVMQNLDQTDGG